MSLNLNFFGCCFEYFNATWQDAYCLKSVFHYANLVARREAKTEIRHRDWSGKKAVAKGVFATESRRRICNLHEKIYLVENGLNTAFRFESRLLNCRDDKRQC